MTNKHGLTIGKLAREAGVGVETIRHYHERGLLARPAKPDGGGYRLYERSAVERVRFIKFAQKMGFSLGEIGELLDHVMKFDCSATRQAVERKLRAVEEQLAELEKARDALRDIAAQCSRDCLRSCPMMERLHNLRRHSEKDAEGVAGVRIGE